MADSEEEYQPLVKSKRTYRRRKSTTISAPAEYFSKPDLDRQIPDIAFNVHGWGLEDALNQHPQYEVINANKATMVKGGFEAKIRELQAKKVPNIYRENLAYSNREKDLDLPTRDSNVFQYLIVGYTLQEDDPLFVLNKTFSRHSEGEIVGEEEPPPDRLLGWNTCRTPILIVTPVKQNTGTSVRLFGLILPRNGLCQPVLTTHERVFYRWEYRASTGSKPAVRNKAWNEIVIRMAREKMPEGANIDFAEPKAPRSKKRKANEVAAADDIIKEESEEEIGIPESIVHIGPGYKKMDLLIDMDQFFSNRLDSVENMGTDNTTAHSITKLQIILTQYVSGIVRAMKTTKSDRILSDLRQALHEAEQQINNSVQAECNSPSNTSTHSSRQQDPRMALARILGPEERVAPDTAFLVAMMKELLKIREWETSLYQYLCTTDDFSLRYPDSFDGQETRHLIDIDYNMAQETFRDAVKFLITAGREQGSNIDEILGWLIRLRECIRFS